MLHTKFCANQVQEKNFFKGFYHIWAWQLSWLCDWHYTNVFSFPST